MEKTNKESKQIVFVRHEKSMLLALLLTLFFGPLGMLYATIGGGLIMIVVNFIVGFLTFGIGLFFTWPIMLVWTILAIRRHNRKAYMAISH